MLHASSVAVKKPDQVLHRGRLLPADDGGRPRRKAVSKQHPVISTGRGHHRRANLPPTTPQRVLSLALSITESVRRNVAAFLRRLDPGSVRRGTTHLPQSLPQQVQCLNAYLFAGHEPSPDGDRDLQQRPIALCQPRDFTLKRL